MSGPQRQLGDFVLEKKLGQGGMGEVYKARQVSLDRVVAVKILPKSLAAQENFIERFQREAKAAANLIHPNVIQIYSIGVEGGTPYFAMEFVEGEDLQQRMKRVGKLAYDESVDVIIGVANALAVAFEKGIVHRDIKPSNVMLDKSGVVKVMDFGLAKATSGEGSNSLTQSGLIMGTPNYISPEQGKGEQIDCRSDIYSLGVVFYELLSGKLPFRADTPAALIYKHAYEPPPPLSSLDPSVPPFLAEIAMRMLQKEPRDRYPNPKALLADLNEFRRNAEYYLRGGTRRTPAITGSSSSGSRAPVSGEMAEAQTMAGISPPGGTGSGQFAANASYSGAVPGAGSGSSFRRADTMPDQNPPLQGSADRVGATIIETGPAGAGGGLGKLVVGVVVFLAIGVGFWFVLGKKLWGPQPGPGTGPGTGGITVATSGNSGAAGTVIVPLSRLAGRIPKGVEGQIQVGLNQVFFAPHDINQPAGTAIDIFFTKHGYKPLDFRFIATDNGVTDPPLETLKFDFELSDEVQDNFDRAKRAIDEKQYSKAMTLLDSITSTVDYEPAKTLRDSVAGILKDFRDNAQKGHDAFTQRRWQDAIDVLSKIPENAEESTSAASTISAAKLNLQSLQADRKLVSDRISNGDFDLARQTIAELRSLLPVGDTSPEGFEGQIKTAEEALANARRERDNKQWQRALEFSEAVLKIAPGNKEAGSISVDARRIVNENLSTQQKIELGLAAGEKALADGQAQRAADEAHAVIVLAPDNKQAKDLLDRANSKITEVEVIAQFGSLDSLFLQRKIYNLLGLFDSSDANRKAYDALNADLQAFFAAPLDLRRAEHGDFIVTRQGDDQAQAETTWTLEIGFPDVKGSTTPAHDAVTVKIRQRVKLKKAAGAAWTFVTFEQVGERIVQ